MLRLETVAIGDELLTGRTSDTNSTFVAEKLFGIGLRLERVTVIPDDRAGILETLDHRSTQSDVLLVFGGLGPTSDDLTAEVVAAKLGTSLVECPDSKAKLLALYGRLGRNVTPAALKQVLYPNGCQPIPNPVGLAPGFVVKWGKATLFFLPGVPREMKAMVEQTVLPQIAALAGAGSEKIHTRTWRLLGIPESELQTRLNPVEGNLPTGAWLGYRTQYPENHLTLYFRGDVGNRPAGFDPLAKEIDGVLRPWCYTTENLPLEAVVLKALADRGWRVAFAESCTGGLVAHRLSQVPGASAWLWGGTVVYQVGTKDKLLGVKLSSSGDAVSAPTTADLAESLRARSGVEVTAAVTGVMGPDPANDRDPVGSIYVSVRGPEGREVDGHQVLALKDRDLLQWGASSFVLQSILQLCRQ